MSIEIAVTDALASRLWSRVVKGPGCWEWTGYRMKQGRWHGQIGSGIRSPRTYLVHRVSWTIHFGPIPSGSLVCHRCDNPCCVRPDHLFVGTQRDNVNDMLSKGRGASPPPPPDNRGERHGLAKLTNEEVVSIRRLRVLGHRIVDIAASFKVSGTTISRICDGSGWRSVGAT